MRCNHHGSANSANFIHPFFLIGNVPDHELSDLKNMRATFLRRQRSHGRGIDVCARGKQLFHHRGEAILDRHAQIGRDIALGSVAEVQGLKRLRLYLQTRNQIGSI
jgi:hypothetical protein